MGAAFGPVANRAEGAREGWRLLILLVCVVLLGGCVPRAASPVGEPVPNPDEFAARLAAATTASSSRQISFRWSLNEAGSRVEGQGVLRAAPDRLRLDLFGPRNETYLSAALVDDELRIPGEATNDVELPSPSLFWGALGSIHPPKGAVLRDATATDRAAVLRYDADGGEVFQYSVDLGGDAPRLERLERVGRSGVIETVEVERDSTGALKSAHYRDWSAYRDLTLDVEKIEDVASFPESIWTP